MATPREYLESVISQAAELQNCSDADLDKVEPELKEADNILDNALAYIKEGV
jgi:hypothetical protein